MTLQNGCKAEGQHSLWKQQLYWALHQLHTVTCSDILPQGVRSFEFKYILSKVIFVFCLSTVCLWVLFWSFHFKCQCKDCYGMHMHHTDLILGRRWDRHLKADTDVWAKMRTKEQKPQLNIGLVLITSTEQDPQINHDVAKFLKQERYVQISDSKSWTLSFELSTFDPDP